MQLYENAMVCISTNGTCIYEWYMYLRMVRVSIQSHLKDSAWSCKAWIFMKVWLEFTQTHFATNLRNTDRAVKQFMLAIDWTAEKRQEWAAAASSCKIKGALFDCSRQSETWFWIISLASSLWKQFFSFHWVSDPKLPKNKAFLLSGVVQMSAGFWRDNWSCSKRKTCLWCRAQVKNRAQRQLLGILRKARYCVPNDLLLGSLYTEAASRSLESSDPING